MILFDTMHGKHGQFLAETDFVVSTPHISIVISENLILGNFGEATKSSLFSKKQPCHNLM